MAANARASGASGASGPSPDVSGDDSADTSPMDDGSAGSLRSHAQVPAMDENDDGSGASDAPAGTMPKQKRRRVSRACDECRRKKIKCDGLQPCTHCAVYSYDCTYDKPSNRRRNPAPQYLEAVEARLHRAEALLRKFMPDVDLSDPSLDPLVQQEFRNRTRAKAQKMQATTAPAAQPPKRDVGARKEADSRDARDAQDAQDAQIMSMIETIGQLDLSDRGEWDFHGTSSSAVFLRRMKEHFKGLLGNDYRTPFLPRPPTRPRGLLRLDSPRSNPSSVWDTSALPNIYELPPQDRVKDLCRYSLECATCLLRIVHVPTFYSRLDRLYELPVNSWGNEENRFLGLMYAVMALGCMYTLSGPQVTFKTSTEEGVKYYASARLILQDVAECRDMISLQSLLFMILFLQASGNLSGCYVFIGIALRTALRIGLHRQLPHAGITPIEDETRRRVFHVIRLIDIYVSAVLGFPMLLRDEDVDQALPTEVDDQYVTETAILQTPANSPSVFQAFNAHVKLMNILKRVVRDVYPLKGMDQTVVNGERRYTSYSISFAAIKAIEGDLQRWSDELPEFWRPSPVGPLEVIRIRTLLRSAYAHVQMILYRPFLHYISPRLTSGKHVDERFYSCAAAGVSVSRNIVHIGMEIKKQSTLIGPYWFVVYSEFFAIISLVFYVVENYDKPGWEEILQDAYDGKEFLAGVAERAVAAERVKDTLNGLFEQLPGRLRQLQSQSRSVPTKKRSLQTQTQTQTPKAGVVPVAGHPAATDDGPTQRSSGELSRPRSTVSSRDVRSATSRDAAEIMVAQSVPGQAFPGTGPDMAPFEYGAVGGAAEGHNAPVPGQNGGYSQTRVSGWVGNPVSRLDAMMFPSEDPFAYPMQPALETARSAARQTPHGGGAQQHEGMPFYMAPGSYDDIEGQLLGPSPVYFIQQQSHRQPDGGLNLSDPNLFNPASVMAAVGLQHSQGQGRASVNGVNGQNGGHTRHGLSGGQTQHGFTPPPPPPPPPPPQQQQRDIDALLADTGFQGDWADLLGTNGAGYGHM